MGLEGVESNDGHVFHGHGFVVEFAIVVASVSDAEDARRTLDSTPAGDREDERRAERPGDQAGGDAMRDERRRMGDIIKYDRAVVVFAAILTAWSKIGMPWIGPRAADE